jgi:hypothetical protein
VDEAARQFGEFDQGRRTHGVPQVETKRSKRE